MAAGKNYGFPNTNRLRKRPMFQSVTRMGVRRFSANFIFFLQPNQLSHPRLGVTVTKKVGNAVRRNRIKRLVREAFRLHGDLFEESFDLVVVAKREMRADSLDDVVREFRHVLGRYFQQPRNR